MAVVASDSLLYRWIRRSRSHAEAVDGSCRAGAASLTLSGTWTNRTTGSHNENAYPYKYIPCDFAAFLPSHAASPGKRIPFSFIVLHYRNDESGASGFILAIYRRCQGGCEGLLPSRVRYLISGHFMFNSPVYALRGGIEYAWTTAPLQSFSRHILKIPLSYPGLGHNCRPLTRAATSNRSTELVPSESIMSHLIDSRYPCQEPGGLSLIQSHSLRAFSSFSSSGPLLLLYARFPPV